MGFFSIISPHPAEESGLLQQEGCNTAIDCSQQYIMLSFPGQEFYLFFAFSTIESGKRKTGSSSKTLAGEYVPLLGPIIF